jgi:maltose alpha-D-glucosyltransferase/alpha-amylase
VRRLIAVRQGYRVFGRGSLSFLMPANRKIIAYVRTLGDEVVLCVANLSRAPQQTSLDLSAYEGRVPVEMFGWSAFQPIGPERYSITLPGHSFFWFLLSETAKAPVPDVAPAEQLPELITLVLPREIAAVDLSAKAVSVFERDILPTYLPLQRWFADKGAGTSGITVIDTAALDAAGGAQHYLALVDVPATGHAYFVPTTIASGLPRTPALERATMARARRGAHDGFLYDGFATDGFVRALIDDIRAERRRPAARGGTFVAVATPALRAIDLAAEPAIRRLNVEQSNTSVVIGEAVMLKGYRRANRGPQPELEVARFLDTVRYRNTPALYGYVEYEPPAGEPIAVAIAQAFVESQGDAWAGVLAYLERFFDRHDNIDPAAEDAADVDEHAIFLQRARTLGVRTAEMHRAFATPTGDPAFEPEPTTAGDLADWAAQARATAERALDALVREQERIPADLRAAGDELIANRAAILARLVAPPIPATVTKTRYHGDYHLGQVLIVTDDYTIVDFEGEPGRELEVRRRKSSPLRDVAGMLRSINYAKVAAVRGNNEDRATGMHEGREPLARDWEQRSTAAFLDGYFTTIAGTASVPDDPAAARALLDLFVLEKAFYEISYELANRPAWLRIPLEGIRAILDPRPASDPDPGADRQAVAAH